MSHKGTRMEAVADGREFVDYRVAEAALRDMLCDWGRWLAWHEEGVAVPRTGDRESRFGGRGSGGDRQASALAIEALMQERPEARGALGWYWAGVARGLSREWGGYVDAESPGLDFEDWSVSVSVVASLVRDWEAWAVGRLGLWRH